MIVGAGEVAMAFYSAVVLALLDERNETRFLKTVIRMKLEQNIVYFNTHRRMEQER